MSHYLRVAASIHGQDRAQQERFLEHRGWVRLVDRADIWCNPSRPGADKHDVFQFRWAIVEAAREESIGPSVKAAKVYHHAGAPL